MMQAKYGNTVKVHYTGKIEDNAVFDTSMGNEPLGFKIAPALSADRQASGRDRQATVWYKINKRQVSI